MLYIVISREPAVYSNVQEILQYLVMFRDPPVYSNVQEILLYLVMFRRSYCIY